MARNEDYYPPGTQHCSRYPAEMCVECGECQEPASANQEEPEDPDDAE